MTKRIHYCYLLTRALPDGGSMYYVGIRTCPVGKTPTTDTKYMGSGRRIKSAVKARRREFTKTILDVFDTRDEAKAMERALVGLPTANSPWSYNLRQGGEDHGLHSEESKARMSRRFAGMTTEQLEEHSHRTAGGIRRAEANKSSDELAALNAKKGSAAASYWATMTHEERSAENKRRANGAATSHWYANATDEQRAQVTAGLRKANERRRAEAQRRKREVQVILAALIVNKYGGAEAA